MMGWLMVALLAGDAASAAEAAVPPEEPGYHPILILSNDELMRQDGHQQIVAASQGDQDQARRIRSRLKQ